MVWSWYGHGMVMVWSWYGHGMVMVWSWYGNGMVMVWSWYGNGMVMAAQVDFQCISSDSTAAQVDFNGNSGSSDIFPVLIKWTSTAEVMDFNGNLVGFQRISNGLECFTPAQVDFNGNSDGISAHIKRSSVISHAAQVDFQCISTGLNGQLDRTSTASLVDSKCISLDFSDFISSSDIFSVLIKWTSTAEVVDLSDFKGDLYRF
uniref:Uncharacterized protein n=1 Tax=Ditylenchus dipsaci TaxID=166011 RepID=A0A915E3Y9_9BILA